MKRIQLSVPHTESGTILLELTELILPEFGSIYTIYGLGLAKVGNDVVNDIFIIFTEHVDIELILRLRYADKFLTIMEL